MNMLERIVARKRKEVPLLHAPADVHPSNNSFVQPLRRRKPSVIAELKPKSPSEGFLFDPKDLSSLLDAYEVRADALSVLCDSVDFGGGYDLLQRVRAQTDLPILAKEFIISEVQVRMARACGADAILLIAAILSKDEAQALASTALSLGMDILFELHTKEDFEKIPDAPIEDLVLGINNRNLDTLAIDLQTTEALAPLLRTQFPGCLLISESGITAKEHVDHLSRFVDGFLIGTTLLRSGDPKVALQSLFPDPI